MLVNWPASLGAPEKQCVRMSPGRSVSQDLRHQLDRLDAADVAHHLAAGAGDLAGADRALEGLEAVARDHVLRHAHLDSDGDVGVFRQRLRRRVGLREVDVEQLGDREGREADVGDVHESVEPRARPVGHGAPHEGEGARARVARRHRGGGALVGHQLVGRDADARGVDVRVQVDQARHDEPARRVHDAVGARGRDVGLQRLDDAEADADVALGAQLLARVEHLAALDDEVELVVRTHGRLHACSNARHRQRGSAGEKPAPGMNVHCSLPLPRDWGAAPKASRRAAADAQPDGGSQAVGRDSRIGASQARAASCSTPRLNSAAA